MIARLTGIPSLSSETTIIDVGGVGYEVFTTLETTSWLNSADSQVTIFIYTHVTESSLELYGFRDQNEKKVFMMLLSVPGVGPKTALGILNMGQSKVIDSLQQADIVFFSKAPRVGKKLAQKIIIELGSKVGSLTELDLKPLNSKQSDIISALISLGYDEQSALQAIRKLPINNLSIPEAIKSAMRNL